MEKEVSRLPAFLQDRKKTLILALVILAMILSSIATVLGGSLILKNTVLKDVKLFPGIKISITSLIPQRKAKLNGCYSNDYANEELYFHKNGTMEYTAGETFVMGTYEMKDDHLTLNLGDDVLDFVIIEKTETSMVLSNGVNMFSFTKTE